jgi:hypothetical protein
VGELVPLDELLRLAGVVLRAEADDSELVGVLSSELLDPGRFGPADGSMRRPEPHQERSIGGELR